MRQRRKGLRQGASLCPRVAFQRKRSEANNVTSRYEYKETTRAHTCKQKLWLQFAE
jgi:hypothetical protein